MPVADINGTQIHYRWDGPEQGPVLMLSNSLASNLHMWDAQMDALLGAGYRVLRYDSRGMGRSAAPTGPYTIEMLAEDAVALLDHLGLDRVKFCGLSKGGMVGQRLGVAHADRVECLVLCDTAASMAAPGLWEERIEAARSGGMAAVVDATVERWFTPAGRERLAPQVSEVRDMILATPVEGFAGCCQAIAAMDQREDIRAITVPTLVIVGEDDPGTPVSAAELIHANITGSKLVVLPEAAHFANVEQADRFNGALLGFLASARP